MGQLPPPNLTLGDEFEAGPVKMVGFEAAFRRSGVGASGSRIWNTRRETRPTPSYSPTRCRVVTHFEVDRTRKVDVKCGAHLPVMGSPS